MRSSVSPSGGVTSVQCLDASSDLFPADEAGLLRLASAYFAFVSRRLPAVRVHHGDNRVMFVIAGHPLLAFELQRNTVEDGRAVAIYRIVGGLLNSPTTKDGTLSIAADLAGDNCCRLCVAVNDYHPRLVGRVGGVLYERIQTPLHRWLGEGFVHWAARQHWKVSDRDD